MSLMIFAGALMFNPFGRVEVDPSTDQEIEEAVLDTLTADLAQGRITADQLTSQCLGELHIRSLRLSNGG